MSEEQNQENEQERTKRPIDYALYRGINGKQGAVQFSLKPAYSGQRDSGAVLIDAAPATGPNKYDWANKIVFALNPNDIGQILVGFGGGKCDIYHDPNAGNAEKRNAVSKRLVLAAGTEGSFKFSLSEKSGEVQKNVTIFIQPHEVLVLRALLVSALPKILGW